MVLPTSTKQDGSFNNSSNNNNSHWILEAVTAIMSGVSTIPFAEPPYLRGLPSPYYTPSHRRFQKACREFLWEHLLRNAMEWERQGTVPEHVFQTFCQHNMLLPNLPAPLPVDWLRRLGIHDILGVKVEDWDYMYSGIYGDEMARSGLAGPGGALTAGFAFGIPPIIKYGSKELQERFLPELLTGKKRSCIAITEPEAGSDVANLTTTATKNAEGTHYIVNGTKKWYVASSCLAMGEADRAGSPTESGPTTPPWPSARVAPDETDSRSWWSRSRATPV